MAMTLRSGRRYHPYRRSGTKKRSYRRSTPAASKRRSRAGPRVTTSKYGKATSTNFRSHKTSIRQYRGALWRNTLYTTHYRSIGSGFTAPVEPATVTPGAALIYLLPALSNQSTNQGFILLGQAFWTTGGGLQQSDTGITAPTFGGDITLRGGIARLMLLNRDDTQLRVRIFGVWANKNPSIAVFTALQGSIRGTEWDPSVIAEFGDFGKILFNKEATLDSFQSVEVLHRFKPQKIDRITHTGSVTKPAGAQLWWMVVLIQNQANAAASGVNFVNSWNLSFSGDTT